jgi:RHS repeat-associated protein
MHEGANAPPQRTVHLKEIVLCGETNNEKLNATTITWGPQNYVTPNTESFIFNDSLPKGYFLPMNRSHDGYTDLVVYAQNADQNSWKCYEWRIDLNKYLPKTKGNHKKDAIVFKADLGGDGSDELCFLEKFNGDFPIYWFKRTTNFSKEIGWNYKQFFLGDFTGTGATDIIFMKDSIFRSFIVFIDEVFSFNPELPINKKCKVRVGDFYGSGTSQLEVVLADGSIFIYYSNANGNFSNSQKGGYANSFYEARYSGDFNGDGVTDLLTYYNGNWNIYFGKGDGTYTNPTLVSGLNPTVSNVSHPLAWHEPKFPIMTADLDGDGKDDIIQIVGNSVNIIYSKGCFASGNQYQYKYRKLGGLIINVNSQPENVTLADVNNDGFLNIVVRESRTSLPKYLQMHKNRKYDCVEKITDGMGKEICFAYKPTYIPATDFNFSKSVTRNYFNFLVSSLRVSNGINDNEYPNKYNNTDYYFYSPALSFSKRTFLGFQAFDFYNTQENKGSSYSFDYNYPSSIGLQIMVPLFTSHYVTGIENGISHRLYYINIDHNVNLFSNGKRYVRYDNAREYDLILKIDKRVDNTLNSQCRLIKQETITGITIRDMVKDCEFTENNKLAYLFLTLNNNPYHKKTVVKSVLSEKDYCDDFKFVDTLTYGFSGTGKLLWERKGNLDGVITTNYGNYDSTGVYKTKTLMAADCTSRTENYQYDNTRRFITKLTNPLGHESYFTYNPKTGKLLSETDPNGLTTFYTYNSFGNLTQIDYPDSTKTTISTYWYTASDIPNAHYYTETKTTGKSKLTVHYDLLGRELRRMQDGVCTDTRYNKKGEVVSTSYPYKPAEKPDTDKTWNRFTYDDVNRVLTEKSPYTNLKYTYDKRQTDMFDSLRGTKTSKFINSMRRVTNVYDAGGEITYKYEYKNNTRHTTTIWTNGTITTISTDLWGNRIKIEESNAETITSKYNVFNELIEQKDARDNITKWQYDLLGRVSEKRYETLSGNIQATINYTYDYFDQNNKGIGKLYQIFTDNNLEETYLYDNLSRLAEYEVINNGENTFTYTYNNAGQLHTLTYPSGFSVKYGYHSSGKMNEIRQSNDNKVIYSVSALNKFYAPVNCTYGNNTGTEYEYNDYGVVTRIQTGKQFLSQINPPPPNPKFSQKEEIPISILPIDYSLDSALLNYRYAYDVKGVMTSRSESVFNRKEVFTHDNLDRLTGVTTGAQGQQTIKYFGNGNIQSNTAVGTYTYHTTKKNAVIKVVPSDAEVISSNNCEVTYNYFNQPVAITEGEFQYLFLYNPYQQRSNMSTTKNGIETEIRYYINKYYEKEKTGPRMARSYNYIFGDYGLVGLYVKDILQTYPSPDGALSNTETPEPQDSLRSLVFPDNTMYYIHTDHLGSYCIISTDSAKVVQRNIFDSWGNFFSFTSSHTQDSLPVSQEEWPRGSNLLMQYHFNLTRRGFTGHEHYPELKIINMNGRLYDPVIGRFFSPDNFVQIPEFTQSFNRYSYCLNNPLKYVDPTGQRYIDFLDDYGLDRNTGRLSLISKTNDDFDVIYTGTFEKNGNFTKNGNTKTISKGILNARNFTEDLSKKGFSTTKGQQEEAIGVMKFISFESNIELSAWGYRDAYDGLNELYINAWDKNTWNHSYKPEFNRYGKTQFLIHTHPGSKDGLGGFGRASEADYNFQSKSQVDYYILSRHHSLTGYDPKTRTDFTPTSNMVPQSLKLYIK